MGLEDQFGKLLVSISSGQRWGRRAGIDCTRAQGVKDVAEDRVPLPTLFAANLCSDNSETDGPKERFSAPDACYRPLQYRLVAVAPSECNANDAPRPKFGIISFLVDLLRTRRSTSVPYDPFTLISRYLRGSDDRCVLLGAAGLPLIQ